MKLTFLILIASLSLTVKAQNNISGTGITFSFYNDSINYNHSISVHFTNAGSANTLVYDYLSLGEKSRFSNFVLEFEQKINGIYKPFAAYFTNYVDLNLTDTSRLYDLPRHILAPGHSEVLTLENMKFGKFASDVKNSYHEFRVRAFMRVEFLNNNAPKEPGDQNDYIEYKESPWFYYRSKN